MSDQVVAALLRHPAVALHVVEGLGDKLFLGPWQIEGSESDGFIHRRPTLYGKGDVRVFSKLDGSWKHMVRKVEDGAWRHVLEGTGDDVGDIRVLIDEYLAGDERFMVVE